MHAGDSVRRLMQDFQNEPNDGQTQPIVAIQQDGRRLHQFAAVAERGQSADQADDAPADHGRRREYPVCPGNNSVQQGVGVE